LALKPSIGKTSYYVCFRLIAFPPLLNASRGILGIFKKSEHNQ
jgi:hypothetical protein